MKKYEEMYMTCKNVEELFCLEAIVEKVLNDLIKKHDLDLEYEAEFHESLDELVFLENFPMTVRITSDEGIPVWENYSGKKAYAFNPQRVRNFLEGSFQKKIFIGDYEVEQERCGIQVGCTFVSDDDIKKIYELRFGD